VSISTILNLISRYALVSGTIRLNSRIFICFVVFDSGHVCVDVGVDVDVDVVVGWFD